MQPVQYARYSTDNQRESSIADQLRLGHERSLREGWPVPGAYFDEGTSGSIPLMDRPGARKLLEDATAGRFDVLLLEGLDRLARDVVEQETIIRRLEHRGIRIIGLTDGYDSRTEGREMMRVVRGSFNQQQLREISRETHRGLSGQISRGFHAGGISYGYRSEVAGLDGAGDAIGHRLVVEPEAARWVRWIFEQYIDGRSPRAIAHELNHRSIAAPRGGTWALSALYGSPAKGSGILNNEIYVGRYIWNRSKWIKDPDTGRRQRIDRPRAEWMVKDMPGLRIIDDTTWQSVRARMDLPNLKGGGRGAGARPKTLFGGLLRCGLCGGAVVAVNATSYGCAAHKDRGTSVCSGLHAKRALVDERLLESIKQDLLAPDYLIEIQRQVAALVSDRKRNCAADGHAARARLLELEREIGNLVDAVAVAGWSDAIKARLQSAEAERARLLASASERSAIPTAISGVTSRYKAILADLQKTLASDPERARPALQSIVGEIRLVTEGKELYAEMKTHHEKLLMAAGGAFLNTVAGAGFGIQKRIRIT